MRNEAGEPASYKKRKKERRKRRKSNIEGFEEMDRSGR
jgi:hypothetical protein